MKQITLFVLSILFYLKDVHAQDEHIVCSIYYNYDNAGNRIKRYYACVEVHTEMLLVNDSTTTDTSQHLTAAIYPNPTAGPVSIVFNNPVNTAQITIADNTGQQLYSTTTGGTTIPLNLNNYAQGVYYVTVKTGGNTFKSTVVKN